MVDGEWQCLYLVLVRGDTVSREGVVFGMFDSCVSDVIELIKHVINLGMSGRHSHIDEYCTSHTVKELIILASIYPIGQRVELRTRQHPA